jgi:hypothetical protein
MTTYLFIDGAYLDRAYETLMKIFGVPGELGLFTEVNARPLDQENA